MMTSPLAPCRLPLGLSILLGLVACSQVAWGQTEVRNRRIQPGQTLSQALAAAGLDVASAHGIITALEGVFDFRRVRPDDQFRCVLRDGVLVHFDYRQGPTLEWQVRREQDRLVGHKRDLPVESRLDLVELTIESSLYEAVLAGGEEQSLAMNLADVFAWDIDFYRDVQKGDRARVLIERHLAKGRTVGYGDILAASYRGATLGPKRIFRYELPNGEKSYFLPDGASARKTFLKSPLKYAHITSRFGRRFHPVLKFVRSHNGVDYGTPIGTPVWAVADGTVTRAGWSGGGGNTLCIRHANGMETCYLHLSKFGRGVKVGARVTQKQVVALSGNTGMSTGPHLHFELRRGGRPINPLNQSFPRAEPIPAELKAHFLSTTAELAARLEEEPAVAGAQP